MSKKLEITVDDKGKTTVFMDGIEIKGIKRIEFDSEVGYTPTHKIEFFSHKAIITDENDIEDLSKKINDQLKGIKQ